MTEQLQSAARRQRLGHRTAPAFDAIFRLACLWLNRRSSRKALAELDDRLLSDIGVSRAQAREEAGTPFWRSRS